MTPEQPGARAEALFNEGLCCSESVLQAVAESRGIESDLIPRIATGLCGGLARTGDICGAVSGGVLAISLVTGRHGPKDSRDENHRRVRLFLDHCKTAFGSTRCEELTGCRLDTPEGQQYFKEHRLKATCAGFCRETAQTACRLIADIPAATH